ncbi:hypothetical protein N183_32545 [Sinorhizobium sp. Sb3]|nr:hypothetical protein N183_32545 [Sinorhizobium sp. Sb3]
MMNILRREEARERRWPKQVITLATPKANTEA